MALFICLRWSACARPTQRIALEPECLRAPGRAATRRAIQLGPEAEGVASPAKEFDVETELDHEWWRSLAPTLEAIKSAPPGGGRFGFPPALSWPLRRSRCRGIWAST
ncbi:unnamed protein product [Prorocentrum cordatum]|uniref:Uncharacterized protein n=1 Tax=Prorocentrum cordatum TaxID=2364126 RepID=A0ABN9RZQ6_9DINO|nr:unnamed protein product [Polarella glacialis]